MKEKSLAEPELHGVMNVLNILDEGDIGESIWKHRLQQEIIKTKFILQKLSE